MKTSQLAICTVATGMLLSTSFATSVQWTIEEGGNGHWYEQVLTSPSTITWSAALAEAESRGGYLVTVTSAGEENFIQSTCTADCDSWAGGYLDNGSWGWVTGEIWDYTNWYPGEPNGTPSYSPHLEVLFKCSGWNDATLSNECDSYIVEYENQTDPQPSLARAKIIAGGGYGWGIAIQPDGTLTGWGENINNVLNLPTELTDGSRRVVKVDAWGWHAMALTEDGELFAWGKNEYGQCNIPAGLGTCIDFSAGGEHSLAVREDGTVWAWGRPDYNATNVPSDLSGVVEIQAGNVHQIYLLEDGTIGGFGQNYNGQCNVPSSVQPPLDFDATESWSMAISDNGAPSVWGFNTGSYGGIDGCNTCIPSEATNIIDMATGHYFAMALTASGEVIAWGDNDSGQCSPPADLDEVVMIHANQDTAFAVHPDGSVTGWGNGAGADVPSDLRVWLLDEVIIDCNGNGVSDYEDIKVGHSDDLNSNYIPDECECLADVDGNGNVDTLDLLMIIARWGQPGPVGDVNFSGYVDVNDLLYIVDSWGGCP